MPPIYDYAIEVSPSAIDANGHVNNVEFVRWMQEAAIAHADERGCTAATTAAGATWVVRSHRIDYSRPAFAGDKIIARTWVADFRRAFSLRKYEFVRSADGVVLAKGETDWVFVDATSGRPKSIPAEIVGMFDLSIIPGSN
ncbi:MAG TPA: acyl-CoA thioesterase [Tepidisphaeraceae bacterium]|jgi:acyl-CoA thioester hydrolase|nr:acyl-CoA thioesterase [Tepidisphaeraceae bacterium]